MSKVSKKVSNWLYSVLQPQYLHVETAYRDIYRFLAVHSRLAFKIRTAVYTSESGHSDLLVNLYGSIMLNEFSIPINIWVPLNYPYANQYNDSGGVNGVPLVFVMPQDGHVLRPGNNVDSQGRFYHPYLSLWHSNCRPDDQSNEFNLIRLMDCLASAFGTSPPLVPKPITLGPQLPPRISDQPTAGSLYTMEARQPLPRRTDLQDDENLYSAPSTTPEAIPARYRSPLPLPSTAISYSPSIRSNTAIDAPGTPSHVGFGQSRGHRSTRSRNDPPATSKVSTTSPSKTERRDVQSTNGSTGIEDLMDQMVLEPSESSQRRFILEQISEQINRFLNSDEPENINTFRPRVLESLARAKNIDEHLSHQNKQARRNIENLEQNISYISDQLSTTNDLCKDLAELDQIHRQHSEFVQTDSGEDSRISLEDLVVPDLTLVLQLYETAAEAKACQDALRLVSGEFKSQPELLNNESLDQCMKAVRGISRDLFWLEVTRLEIAKSMGLQI